MHRGGGDGRLFSVNITQTGTAHGPGGAARWPGPAKRPDDAADPPQSVTDLFRDHHLELVRLALVMVQDLATAEDVVQDAFERLHRGWPSLRQPESSLSYVRSSVLNGCRSVHRRAAMARKHEPRLAEPAEGAGPDGASAAADRGEMVAALRRLPRRQREVLVLRYYLDLDVDEVASTLRINPGTVRSTTARGLARLAAVLQEGRNS
jgi:RNA polymerase sigma-70 factor (sigma-E family)